MSRAASMPLPPPPRGSVWSRIERARAEDEIPYHRFSRESGSKSGSHYRGIAFRDKWQTKDATREAYIHALVKRGWSERWLQIGEGPERADGSSIVAAPEKQPPTAEEVRAMRWRALQALRDMDSIVIERAERLVEKVKLFPHPDLSWGDFYVAARRAARDEDAAAERKKGKAPAV